MWIVNGHRIINVLKATRYLDAFASKYVDCPFYGSFCGGICMRMVLDVLRPWKRPGRKGMLRLGMGWALAACSWPWIFGTPLPKTPVLASSIHHPVEDAHQGSHLTKLRMYPLGSPGFGHVGCSWVPDLKLHRWDRFAISRLGPQVLANTSPWEMPHTMNISTEMQSLVPPTLSDGAYS